MPKKPDGVPGGAGEIMRAAVPGKTLDKMPVLASYLLDLAYEEGAGPREPSYLLVRAGGGEWLITLKDPTEQRQLRLRVTDLGTVWAALEALLTSGTCPWEPDSFLMRNGKYRKK